MTYFTPDQAATLTRLYPDADEWFTCLWIFTDAVQESDEVAADGLRWLCEVRQRPFKQFGGCRWWGTDSDRDWNEWMIASDRYNNYLTHDFYQHSKCDVDTRSGNPAPNYFTALVPALDAFVSRWCALTPERRAELWVLAASVSVEVAQ